jgi:hypothetical protein
MFKLNKKTREMLVQVFAIVFIIALVAGSLITAIMSM